MIIRHLKGEVRKRGYEEIGGTPEEANARINTDVVRWTKIIHDAGIEPQ
jgi:tripartite-type tricarboxylate transporter receptor subunit TctC